MSVSFTKVTWVNGSANPAISAANLQRYDDTIKTLADGGHGSGMDADTLDGHQPGPGGGLDADTVDGIQGSEITVLKNFRLWESTKTYTLYEPCFYKGIPYRSLLASNYNKIPSSNPTSWEVTGGSGGSGDVSNPGYTWPNLSLQTSVNDWVAYKDAAQATPVDGTGGTAVGLGFALTEVSPLISYGDGLLSKSAVNAQGEGVSTDGTLDLGRTVSAGQISFVYKTGGTYVDGDIGVYLMHIASGTFVPLSVVNLPASYGSPAEFLATFIPSGSGGYRLILHTQTTNAAAWTLQVSSFEVGKKNVAVGAAIGGWKSWIPVSGISGLPGSWDSSSSKRRIGSNLEIALMYNVSGAGIDEYSFNIVAELNLLGLSLAPNVNRLTGPVYFRDSSASSGNSCGSLYLSGGLIYFTSSERSYANAANPFTWASGDILIFNLSVPIAQWTSNVNLASDFTEYASNDGSGGTAAGGTYTTGMQKGRGGSLVLSVASTTIASITQYKVDFSNAIQDSDEIFIEINKGDGWFPIDTGNINIVPFSRLYNCYYGIGWQPISGNKYSIYVQFGNAGRVPNGATYGSFGAPYSDILSYNWRVRKVSNGNMAEIPPVVRAEYYGQTATPVGGLIKYIGKIEDTHSAYNISTGLFTAPIDGIYLVNATVVLGAAVDDYAFYLYKDSGATFIDQRRGNGTDYGVGLPSRTVRLLKGNTIGIQAQITALPNYQSINYKIAITRIGS